MLVGELGEEKLLDEIRKIFAVTADAVPVGIGDDAAVTGIQSGLQLVWTSDLMLEGVHFQLDWQSPEELGRKSLAINLSDLAAMGSKPAYCLLSLACPGDYEVEKILGICRGLSGLALEMSIAVIGGDTCNSTSGLVASIAAAGTVEKGRAVLRSGARVGDTVYVTGQLGSAAAGLRLLRSGDSGEDPGLREAFINPVPRTGTGTALAGLGVSAMTDISDGLASDLRHICESSDTGALVSFGDIPVRQSVRDLAAKLTWQLEEVVLQGGEDYELLFTADQAVCGAAINMLSEKSGIAITAIGRILPAAEGLTYIDAGGVSKAMPPHGFDHFRDG